MTTQHPFAVGDKIRFSATSNEFNQRFLARFFEDSKGVVTVTDATTEPDGFGTTTHYVRLAEDSEPINDEGADQGVLRDDSNTVSHRLTRIRNHHRLTLPVPALKEIS